jgi:hypothetical protein
MRPQPAAYFGSHDSFGRHGDERDWSEAEKIQGLHPDLQGRVTELLKRLRARGFRNVKLDSAWRSIGTQFKLAQKRPSVTAAGFSWHSTVDSNGFPAARAADFIGLGPTWPSKDLWSHQNPFWAALREEGSKLGLQNIGVDLPHLQIPLSGGSRKTALEQAPQILGAQYRRVAETDEKGRTWTWRQWPNGWVQLESGPSGAGKLFFPGLSTKIGDRSKTSESAGTKAVQQIASIQAPFRAPGWKVPGPFASLADARAAAASASSSQGRVNKISRVAPVRRGTSAPSTPAELAKAASPADLMKVAIPTAVALLIGGIYLSHRSV